jgi:hypothetical protein
VTVDGQSLDIDAETPARTITGATHRLMEFASGRPDSRADAGTDWLRGLTDEQLRTVSGWIVRNEFIGNERRAVSTSTG